jgi:hypothetical protein
VNEKTRTLNTAVADSLSKYGVNEQGIRWISPLAEERYSEYRDSEFLELVGFDLYAKQLSAFWPKGGPCWDALARIQNGCILLEAKSHVAEIEGGGCKASSMNRPKIERAFDATKAWLGVATDIDWMGRLYQSANRYAHLYFLREVVGVQAFLINVYFINDPRTRTAGEEWERAIERVSRELGLLRDVPYTGSIFLTAE